MIVGVACNCHGSPNLFRQFLFANHVPNYLSVPLYQGDKARKWAEENNLPEILNYIDNHSSYVLIVGWGDSSAPEWVDINNATPEREMKAEMILEQFAPRRHT